MDVPSDLSEFGEFLFNEVGSKTDDFLNDGKSSTVGETANSGVANCSKSSDFDPKRIVMGLDDGSSDSHHNLLQYPPPNMMGAFEPDSLQYSQQTVGGHQQEHPTPGQSMHHEFVHWNMPYPPYLIPSHQSEHQPNLPLHGATGPVEVQSPYPDFLPQQNQKQVASRSKVNQPTTKTRGRPKGAKTVKRDLVDGSKRKVGRPPKKKTKKELEVEAGDTVGLTKHLPKASYEDDLNLNTMLVSASDTDTGIGSKPPVTVPTKVDNLNAVSQTEGGSTSDEEDGGDTFNAKISVEEKQKLHRDRNREHARNTRLRKKLYVENLINQVEMLSSEMENNSKREESMKRAQIDQRKANVHILLKVLGFWAVAEKNVETWNEILDPEFIMHLPITPFRHYPPNELLKNQRVLHGINAFINDAQSFQVMINGIANRRLFPSAKVNAVYRLVLPDMICVGNTLMTKFTLITTNAVACGAKREVELVGMLKCTFNGDNKIKEMNMMYDCMSYMAALKDSCSRDDNMGFDIIPNTLQMCKLPSVEMRIIFRSEPPHTVSDVNGSWCEFFQYNPSEIIGRQNLFMLKEDNENSFSIISDAVSSVHAAATMLYMKRKDGTTSMNYFKIFPVWEYGQHGDVELRLLGVADPGATIGVQSNVATSMNSTAHAGSIRLAPDMPPPVSYRRS